MAPEEMWVLEEKAQGDIISVYKYLIGEYKEDEPILFSVVSNGRIRDNGHKLKHMRSI